jgi:hypothetical protein
MTFALFNLNGIELLFLLFFMMAGLATTGVVLWFFVLNPRNRGTPSSRQDELDRLREDNAWARERISALEEENRRLRQEKSAPSEGHFAP